MSYYIIMQFYTRNVETTHSTVANVLGQALLQDAILNDQIKMKASISDFKNSVTDVSFVCVVIDGKVSTYVGDVEMRQRSINESKCLSLPDVRSHVSEVPIINNHNISIADLKIFWNQESISLIWVKQNPIIFLGSIVLLLLLIFVVKITLDREQATLIEKSIQELVQNKEPSLFIRSKFPYLAHKWVEMKKTVEDYSNERIKLEKAVSLAELASQVAHDIRSPLSALNMISSTLTNVPEEKRILIRNSIQRINDIANDLLAKSKVSESSHINDASNDIIDSQSKNGNSKSELVLLPTLIDAIISEKRIHFRDKVGVQIEADINQSYGVFVNLNANEFSRLLSNLINNSVEAFSDANGKVAVCLRKYGDKVSIVVQDNGKGIPSEVLAKLGERGVTHGKDGTQSGSGLGVWHAKTTIESFGGQFQINSKVGEGTQMVMNLPIVESPAWFQPNLSLQPLQKIISLDDDMSIHGIWRGRLESINTGAKQPELLNFTSGIEFKKYVQELSLNPSEKVLFLIDFELLNQSQTGLDIIDELNLSSKKNYQVILVTSRYDEQHIRSRCAALGIKLIPKNMAGFVPIEIEPEKEKYDCVLIDDESLNHMTWSLYAKENNKSIKSFNKMADFMVEASKIDLASPIYIDSNLGAEGKGEAHAEAVSNLGFRKIYIATGFEPDLVRVPVCVTNVVGKDPLF
jgi:signal transduction histidine kinase